MGSAMKGRSRFLRGDDDDAGVFGQLHRGIERAHQAVLHNARRGNGVPRPASEVMLDRFGDGIRRKRGRFQARFRRDALIEFSSICTAMIGFGLVHRRCDQYAVMTKMVRSRSANMSGTSSPS